MNGPDNTANYIYIGTAKLAGGFNITPKSKVTTDATSFKVFNYIFNRLRLNTLESFIEFYHHNKCGKCGRTLTVPESVIDGIGPECKKMLNKNESKQVKLKLS